MELLLVVVFVVPLVGIPNGSERSHRSRDDEEVEMVAEGVVTLDLRPCSVTTKSSSKPLSAWDMLPLFGDE